MLFKSSNYSDIDRYFRNTYVKFKETGDQLFYVKKVSPAEVTGVDSKGDVFELWLSDNEPYEVDYVLPHKSYFQHGKFAHLMQRIPAKQYRRGISTDNTSISRLKRTGSVDTIEIGFSPLEAFVSKQAFYSLELAEHNGEKNYSCVLSSRFAYVPETRQIYVDNVPVAKVYRKGFIVEPIHPVFIPELKDLLQNSMYKVKE